MAFIGDSLVSCTNETLANTWYDIASKKDGLRCGRTMLPGAN